MAVFLDYRFRWNDIKSCKKDLRRRSIKEPNDDYPLSRTLKDGGNPVVYEIAIGVMETLHFIWP